MINKYSASGALFISAVSILFCFSSCKVTTYSFLPAGSTYWNNGRDYQVVHSEDSIELQTTFLMANYSEVKFNMQFFNHSSSPFLIDPAMIYLKCKDTLTGNLTKTYGKDPEYKIKSLDSEISKNERLATTTKGENAGRGMELLHDLTGKEMSKEDKAEYAKQREEATARNITVRDQARSKLMILDKEKSYWEHETLRKNTIFSDESVRGDIYFTLQPKAHSCFIAVQTPEDTVFIPYYQVTKTW